MSAIVLHCENTIHCKQDLSGRCQWAAMSERLHPERRVDNSSRTSGLEVCSPFALVCWFLKVGLWDLHEAARNRISDSRRELMCSEDTEGNAQSRVSAFGSSLRKLTGWQEGNGNLQGWRDALQTPWVLP